MARASKSAILSSLRGLLGDIVIRKTRNGIVVSRRPQRRKKKLSKAQSRTCNRFAEAVAHGKKVLAEFRRENPGVRTVKKGKSVYHTAMAEYLKKKID
jgi:hypothetical protein